MHSNEGMESQSIGTMKKMTSLPGVVEYAVPDTCPPVASWKP